MVFPAIRPVYRGLPKGLREACRERFGAEAISGKRHEDLVGLLSACEDFKNQATILEDQAAERGRLSKRSKDRVEGAQDAEDLTIELICKHFSRADPKSSDQHASISHSIEKENH
ncbi:hypothetical protein Pmar_PMAR003857 [Perkinsus marinus ATCC 50983]|uniref:Uncharacterized protein n=1 Tax=Perkinsus marinus (strain ATCC 50983 / TXsc) TaxID=423536 RepID=C5LX72_PERM5|nr:hypothetical protein Pmar_PMAR003857 [Perkinsus marinus ATCC 50983]EEQ98670.1 hypothetical protein Pmar_PMAR003857 [Perkinsus marinus ATCC 50983]|eukprot:XP_002765953.1 hypothetical protein Pmar_PMAR003857 [Perkinsus marinus ATCC 50983]